MLTRAELRIAITILVVGVVLAIPAIYGRYQVEQAYRTYEITVDLASLRLLAEAEGLSLTEAAKRLKAAGATGLSVPVQTVADLLATGKAIFVPAAEREAFQYPAKWEECILSDGVLLLPAGYTVPTGISSLAFDHTFVGLDPQAVDVAESVGLDLVPRIPFIARATEEQIRQVFAYLDRLPGRPVIFEGEAVLGYPDRLGVVSEQLNRNALLLGAVEFSTQKGLAELAARHRDRLVRVHTITPEETDLINPRAATARWIRAASERNMRLLYFHPYLPHSAAVGEGASALEVSVQTLESITTGLAKAGYHPGPVPVLPVFPLFDWSFFGAVLGLAAGAYLLSGIVLEQWWIRRVMLIVGALGAAAALALTGLYLLGGTVPARQCAALGIAITFPALAVLLPTSRQRLPLTALLQMLALMLAGVLLIIAALAQPEFLLKTRQFLGVKLMHLLPPLIVGWVFWRQGYFRNLLANRVTWLVLPVALLAVVYLVLRTGNIVVVASWERQARDLLEQLLVVRPRTKEFMLGHPALLAGFWALNHFRNPAVGGALLTIGTIGVLSVLNTFTHAHTPLAISALRTVNGLWLGALLGLVAIFIIRWTIKEERR